MKSLHHSFDIDLATKYGVHEAILIHHFQHWICFNQKLDRNKHEGRTWTYQTLDELAAHFPYLSKSEVFELIERLCNGKGRRSKKKELDFQPILMRGNFNKHNYDRTIWYAFVDEKMFTVLASAKMDVGASQNGYGLEPTPIPDTKPDTKEKKTTKEKTKKIAVGNRGGVFFERTCNEFKNLSDGFMAELKRTFPNIDILHQLELMRMWLIDPDNPKRIGNAKFITGWLSRQIPVTAKMPPSVLETEPVMPLNPHMPKRKPLVPDETNIQ